MVKNELSIMINRPIEEVFDYVSNLQYGPQWQTGLVEVRQITQGAPAAGSQFASARKFLGRKLEAVVEITALRTESQNRDQKPVWICAFRRNPSSLSLRRAAPNSPRTSPCIPQALWVWRSL